MIDPPEVKDYLSGLRRTPKKDTITETQQENSESKYSKKNTVITSENDQVNPFIATSNLGDTTPKASPVVANTRKDKPKIQVSVDS